MISDWIGLGVILLILAGGLWGLSRLGEPPKPLTQEEYDRRINEGGGFLSAGVMGLQKILEPGVERAAAVLEDFRQGHYDGEQESGEGDKDDEGAPESADSSTSSQSKESDA